MFPSLVLQKVPDGRVHVGCGAISQLTQTRQGPVDHCECLRRWFYTGMLVFVTAVEEEVSPEAWWKIWMDSAQSVENNDRVEFGQLVLV